jgi:CheY-like chemotaxis protein
LTDHSFRKDITLKIPLCFYPTQVILIDDNSEFLATLSLALSKQFNVKPFTDTALALKYINEQEREIKLTEASDTPKPEGDSEVWVKQVLSRQNIKRFDEFKAREVSVVVADYSMPSMNGIEFCERIQNSSIRKILLTGYATSTEAVKAFNNNTIHYYLKKNDENMLQELEETIHQLQHKYFNEISSSIKAEAIDSGTPFFADLELARYFKKSCEGLDVIEYYYLTNPSRFALKTKDNRTFLCIIYTADDITEHLQVIKEEGGPDSIYAAIKSHAFIPYFPTADGYYEPGIKNPENNIHPADTIKGKTNYYCAVIPDAAAVSSATPTVRAGQFH